MFFCSPILEQEYITIPLSEYQSLLALSALVVKLEGKIRLLEEEISLLKNGRNSKTSSIAPSHDIAKSKSKSLREASGLKTGGQQGHQGSTLKMVTTADEIKQYRPYFCTTCGNSLEHVKAELVTKKQEIELPTLTPKYIEHQSYSCRCTNCGIKTVSKLPVHLKGNIQYGSSVSALLAYLSVRQYVPYNRVAEMMRDCFAIPLSEGTVDNLLDSIAQQALPMYKIIQQRVEESKVVGGDETGIKINGNKGWLFTFQTPTLTFLTASLSRGYDSILNVFANGFPMASYVSDCLAAQLKVPAKYHQICTAHLLRELTSFSVAFNCPWANQMKHLLVEAIELKKELQPTDYLTTNEKVTLIANRLDELLSDTNYYNHQKIKAFVKRLQKNKTSILTFLYHQKVPPDNNASERAIRNAKVKMKVSNQFKTLTGANRFAIIRSVIDTTIKNSQNVLQTLTLLPNFRSAE